jgi:hypothetical protein
MQIEKLRDLPEYLPRRPLDDDKPDGYMESDRDYLLNNRFVAVALLDEYAGILPQLLKAVEALELARGLVDDAIYEHIYSKDSGEEPDEDCRYTAFLKQADEILEGLIK